MLSPVLIRELSQSTDMVVGTVLVAGAKTSLLITRDMLSTMKKGDERISYDKNRCINRN